MSETNAEIPAVQESPEAKKPLEYAPPPPPTSLQRMVNSTRRWVRDTFNREQLFAGLKQFAWVAPLTIFIWVYAEREQTTEIPVRFPIEVRTSNPRVVVRLAEPSDGYVTAKVSGPRKQLDDLRKGLGPQSNAVRFEVPVDFKDGEHQVSVAAIASRDARFDGLSVSTSEPNRITVVVDPLEEATIPVQIRKEDAVFFEQVVFNPEKIKVRVPRMASREVTKAGGQLTAYADLSTLKDSSSGKRANVSGIRVNIDKVDPGNVTVEPSTVSVSLTVKDRAKTRTIASVNVRANVPPKLSETTLTRIEPANLVNVVVSGPPEAIDALAASSEELVKAYVEINPEDKDRSGLKKEPKFETPKGTEVIEWRLVADGKPKELLDVTVTSRPAP